MVAALHAAGADGAVLAPSAVSHAAHDVEARHVPDATMRWVVGEAVEPQTLVVVRLGGGGDADTSAVEPGTAPTTSPANATRTAHALVLVRRRDAERERWDGPRMGVDGARRRWGDTMRGACASVEFADVDDVERVVRKWWGGEKLTATRKRGVAVLPAAPHDKHVDAKLLERVRAALDADANQVDPGSDMSKTVMRALDAARAVKSPAEIELIREAGKVSGLGHLAAMRLAARTKAGALSERMVRSVVEATFLEHGADDPHFATIAAGAERATVLHYVRNDQDVRPGEMLLLDAGARMPSGYGGDISRTFPVGGPQMLKDAAAVRAAYEVVLFVQERVIASVRSGATLPQLHRLAVDVFADKLDDLLGRLPREEDSLEARRKRVARYFPHGIGHHLGLDVHDVPSLPRTTPLEVGAVVTVEPGLYFPPDDASVPASLRGLGIRIEDNVAVGAHGADVLTPEAPKKWDDLVALASS